VPTDITVPLVDYDGTRNGQAQGTGSFQVFDIPATLRGVVRNIYGNWPDGDSNYDTVQLGFQKRFTGGFFVQSSFDYQVRDELRGGTGASTISVTTSPLNTDPLNVGYFQNVRPEVSNRQQTSNWQARLIGRYAFKYDIGVGANLRVQSGYGYSRVITATLLNAGTVQFFQDDLDNRYSDTVPILDLRVDKAFRVRGARLGIMLDLFNALNSNAVSNFVVTNGSNFNRIIATLDPRTTQIALRVEF
jgi:hypothetical protein